MNTESDLLAAIEFHKKENKHTANDEYFHKPEHNQSIRAYLEACTHIRSTVVAPLEAKLAQHRKELKEVNACYDEQFQKLKKAEAQLSEAQRVIGEEKEENRILKFQVTELMEFVSWLNGFEREALHWSVLVRRRELLETLAKHPAPGEEKAE